MTGERTELCNLSIAELGPLFRQRRLSPVEVAEAVLARVTALNDRLNAFCAVDPDHVRAQARRAEAHLLRGAAVSPLCGVPISIKDLLFTNDLPTAGGSARYRTFVPDEDDVVVERLRAAGAVIVGKTNVSWFGYGVNTKTPAFGVTRNPWNLERTSGGSSGGSAVAVATGMGPATIGSDGGGSIRMPSSYCGTYGFKPSFGRVPMYPAGRDTRYPGFSGWESLECLGPITRTVTDAALVLDAIVGPDRRDRHSLPRPETTFAEFGDADLTGLRIAWTLDLGGYARVDANVGAAIEGAVRTFEALGASVEQATPFADRPGQYYAAILALDSDLGAMRTLATEMADAIDPGMVAVLERERTFAELSEAAHMRRALYNQLWRFFERYDLLVTPTTPTVAFPHQQWGPDEIGGTPNPSGGGTASFTLPFNLTGSPAASIPVGWTDDGMPIGLQIVGGHLADALVLRASRAFEQAAPWRDRRPPILAS